MGVMVCAFYPVVVWYSGGGGVYEQCTIHLHCCRGSLETFRDEGVHGVYLLTELPASQKAKRCAAQAPFAKPTLQEQASLELPLR